MKEYRVRDNEDIFSVATKVYGSPAYAFKIANDNGIEINDSLPSVLEYDETLKAEVLAPFVVQQAPENLSQVYIPLENQSIFDVLLMTVGGFENIVEFLRNSTLSGINSKITSSDRFVFTDTKNQVKTYLRLTGRTFASNTDSDEGREHDDSFSRAQFT